MALRLPVIGAALVRRQERRRARRLEEQRFLDDCQAFVDRRAHELEAAGLARILVDPLGGDAPPSVEITPTAAGAVGVWVGFDWPTFFLRLPHPDHPQGFTSTAELFGTFPERRAEVEKRIEAIVAGRITWTYDAKRSGVTVLWLGEDETPFLESVYWGASQGSDDASGRGAPYA